MADDIPCSNKQLMITNNKKTQSSKTNLTPKVSGRITSILRRTFKEFDGSAEEEDIIQHYIAAAHNYGKNDDVIHFLQREGFDVQKTTSKRRLSPLHIAAQGYDNVLKPLVSLGVDVNVRDIDDNTPLHKAVKRRSLFCVKALLALDNVEVDAKNKKGHTPLFLAANDFDIYWGPIVLSLLKAGARCDFKLDNGNTILHKSVSLGPHDVTKLICSRIKSNENGIITVNDVNQNGDTAAHLLVGSYNDNSKLASGEYIIKTLRLLVKAGANLEIKNKDGDTPLNMGMKNHLPEEVINYLKDPSGLISKGTKTYVSRKLRSLF